MKLNQPTPQKVLRDKVAEVCGLPSGELLLVELNCSGTIYRFPPLVDNVKRLNCCQPGGAYLLYAFQIPPPPVFLDDQEESDETIDVSQVEIKVGNGTVPNGLGLPVSHSRSASNVSVASTSEQYRSSPAATPTPSWAVSGDAPVFGTICGYTIGLHRKMEHQEQYFLAHQRARPVIFGLPVVLPANCSAGSGLAWTGKLLYESVWTQVSRLLLSQAKAQNGTAFNHATDCDANLTAEYPYQLRWVQRGGVWCSKCPWYRFCYGCLIPINSESVVFDETSFVAVDWDQIAVHLRYQNSLEMICIDDESVAATIAAHNQPVTLDSCLQAFTKQEELGDKDTYYCSKCKAHCSARKKLDIWKLPPFLIVHLKRFQYVGNRWVKSCKMVDFARESFDPTHYLPSPSVCPPNEHNGQLLTSSSDVCTAAHSQVHSTDTVAVVDAHFATLNGDVTRCENGPTSLPLTNNGPVPPNQSSPSSWNGSTSDKQCLIEDDRQQRSPVRKLMQTVASRDKNVDSSLDPSQSKPDAFNKQLTAEEAGNRYRTESCTSAVVPMLYPNDHRLKQDADPDSLLYDLYAIACHYGVMGAGHYVSYAKNPNSRWYLFNDSRCKEVDPDEIDGNYAYLLFYERRGLDYARYIPDIQQPEQRSDTLTTAEANVDFAQPDDRDNNQCNIS